MPAFTRTQKRISMVLAFARRQIRHLGPYQSLMLLLLPVMLIEPLKIGALCVAGEGHWLTGTGIMIAAYSASLVVVERVFEMVKPKLMTLSWFARLWTWFTGLRRKAWAWVRALAAKHSTAREPTG
jgi:hypothetical protein